MKRLFEQIVKFGMVGVLATLLDYGILMLLSQIFLIDPVISSGISYSISLVFNYIVSMKYVFTHREEMSSLKEFTVFLVLSLIGLVFNQIIMWIGTGILGTDGIAVTIVKAVATGVVMVWNFISRKIFLDAGDVPEQ